MVLLVFCYFGLNSLCILYGIYPGLVVYGSTMTLPFKVGGPCRARAIFGVMRMPVDIGIQLNN